MTELTPFDEGYVPPPPPPPPPPPVERVARSPRAPAAPKAERGAAQSPHATDCAPLTDAELDTFRDDFDLGDRRERKADINFDRSKWGLFFDMPAEEYFADPCPDVSISNSGISTILNETLQDYAFKNPRLNKVGAADRVKASIALRRGDVVHQLALGKGKGYAVGDFKSWQSNDAKAFKEEAEDAGLTPIIRKNFDEARKIAAVVREQIRRKLDGAAYQTEVVFIYQEMTQAGPVWVRGMLDVWCEERAFIIDPKITPRIYGDKVNRQLVDMGWDRQGALYVHALGQVMPDLAGRVRFGDLMVKPEAPFTSRFVACERAWSASSIHECRDAIERFGKALYRNEWPGFPDKLEYLTIPPWEDKRREAKYLGDIAK